MEQRIANVLPSGAPWGGPESVSLMSCFASMVMSIDGADGTQPLYCCQGPGLCNRCGKCANYNGSYKYHEQVYHLYLTLSGLACLTLWPSDGIGLNAMHQPWLAMDVDDAIARAMDFAGYQYVDEQADAVRALRASIDAGRPALVYGPASEDWLVATGYTDDSMFDAVGKRHPFDTVRRTIAVTGRKQRRTGWIEEFRYLSAMLREPGEVRGHVAGLAAHDAVAVLLRDDAFFAQADQSALEKTYDSLHAFIGMLAEDRCFAAMAMLEGLYGDERLIGLGRDVVCVCGGFFMETHNRCWDAWAALGGNYIPEPQKNAALLRERTARNALLAIFQRLRRHDELAAMLMEEAADTPFILNPE